MEPRLPAWVEVSRTRNAREARDHLLVLQSMGIPHGQARQGPEHVLVVREEDAGRALEQLDRYRRENVGWPPREDEAASIPGGVRAAVAYGGLLLALFLLDRADAYGLDWWRNGRAVAQLIREGEWWRAATALGLHSDVTHLAGNVVFGAAYGWILSRSIGIGLAWAAILLSGTLGNLLNAWIQPPSHASVGASTAVFGALGVQMAYEWMRRRELRTTRTRKWMPLAMGIALLAWTGMGGAYFHGTNTARETRESIEAILERVDVMAHVTGLAAGLAIGAVIATQARRRNLRGRWQVFLAWIVLASVALAWLMAFRAG